MITTLTYSFRVIPLLLIRFYQKFISPYKGFRCASNVLHKNGSCSGIIFKIIQEEPISDWRKKIKSQFDCCREANLTLKNQCQHNIQKSTVEHNEEENKKDNEEKDNYTKQKRNEKYFSSNKKDSTTGECFAEAACCSAEHGAGSCLRGLRPSKKSCDDCLPSSKNCDDCMPNMECSECGVSSCL